MHTKIESSLKSLVAWVDKILTETKGRDWRLQGFIETYNIHDFQKFYKELQPYISLLKANHPEHFEHLAEIYVRNGEALTSAMKEHFFLFQFFENFAGLPLLNRSAKELIEVLQHIHSNTVNIITAVKVLQS